MTTLAALAPTAANAALVSPELRARFNAEVSSQLAELEAAGALIPPDDLWDPDDPDGPALLGEEDLYDDLLPPVPMSRVDALEWEQWAGIDQDEAERAMLRRQAPDWVFLPPGADLAAALEPIRPQDESPVALIELMKAASRMSAWAESIKVAAMASFHRQRKAQAAELPRPSATDSSGRPVDPERSWAAEVGAALRLSTDTAARHIETALHLTGPLTATHTALRCGALSWSKALRISEATRSLSDSAAQAVESHVLRRAPGQTHANLARSLRTHVAKHNAKAEADQHRESVRDRTCKIVPLSDGMAGLWVVHTADKIQQMWVVIQAMTNLARRETPTPTPNTTTDNTTPAAGNTATSGTSAAGTPSTAGNAVTPGTADPGNASAAASTAIPDTPADHTTATTSHDTPATDNCAAAGNTSDAGNSAHAGTSEAGNAGGSGTLAEADLRTAGVASRRPTGSAVEDISTASSPHAVAGAGHATDDAAGARNASQRADAQQDTAHDQGWNGGLDWDRGQGRDGRTAEQRRADVVADLFEQMLRNGLDWLGRRLPDQHRRRPHIEVLIPANTLLGLDDDPCELTGYGPIPAELARRIAEDGTWRRLLTDPTNGTVLEASTTRHDPGALVSETLLARHPVCAWPGCNRASRECDRDHGTPFAQSGRTSLAGLAPYCEYHHVIKDTPAWGWKTTNHPDGSVTLTTPTGHRYTTVPPTRGPITNPPQPTSTNPSPHSSTSQEHASSSRASGSSFATPRPHDPPPF
jgi:hypothetical protein